MFIDLLSRANLVGKCVVVQSFDSSSKRYAVLVDVTSETVRVLEKNVKASIFQSGGLG
jgi:hypothetical protein